MWGEYVLGGGPSNRCGGGEYVLGGGPSNGCGGACVGMRAL